MKLRIGIKGEVKTLRLGSEICESGGIGNMAKLKKGQASRFLGGQRQEFVVCGGFQPWR